MTDYLIHHVETTDQLTELAERLAKCEQIAVDCEGKGMHAYFDGLCVLQVSWVEGRQRHVAIVDTIACPLTPLAATLGDGGPLKLLHDLTFDVRLLSGHGVTLGHVADTAVAAQMTSEPAMGLASLCKKHLNVELAKAFQDHNWAQRPLTDAHIRYLCLDVIHLDALHASLSKRIVELDVAPEVAVATQHKLSAALAPPRPTRPAHLRLKGYQKFRPNQKAIAFALTEARDQLARDADVPAFRIAPNGLLEAIARRATDDRDAIEKICGRRPARKHAKVWQDAVRKGLKEGRPPKPPSPPDDGIRPGDRGLHRKLVQRLQRWRKVEAARRGVDLQVVLPGHAVSAVARELLPSASGNVPQLDTIAGLGACRVDRYSSTWRALAMPKDDAADA